jgi:hypothetical protein
MSNALYYAKPYQWWTGDLSRNERLVEAFADHPEFLTYPADRATAKRVAILMFTNPEHVCFEVWKGPEFSGAIVLTRIVPKVDALLHFGFIDKDLVGKRKLLHNFITFCFTDLGFNRLSMECPEGSKIERFARRVLRFKYEGESRPRNPELPKALDNTFVARQGSRIERSYFDGTTWSDILRLRILACEWVGTGEGGQSCQHQSLPQPQHPLSVESPEK